MSGLFIAGYVLFGLMTIFGGIYLYTLYMYTKHILFNKTKYNSLTFLLYGLTFIVLIVMGSLFATIIRVKMQNENFVAHVILCFTFAFIVVVNCVGYILIIKFNNKNKIALSDIANTDFKPALEQAKQKIGDVEKYKSILSKHHKTYLNAINSASKEILEHLKDQNIPKSQKYAYIVEFNNNFSHKWCVLPNNYQILLTYEFLTLI